MQNRLVHGAICLGLAILTLGALGQVCGHDFINLDDGNYVTANRFVFEGLTGPDVRWAFTTFNGGYWMPVTWLSFQVDATLFWPRENSFDPAAASQAAWGFHLTNLLFHLANVLLFYGVLVRFTAAPGRSVLAAALFAVHPLHVESVAWITERKDVLSTFFLLACLWTYHSYVRTRSRWAYLALFALFFLGLASKPMLVTLPCGLLLLDYWPLGRLRWGQRTSLPAEELPAPASLPWVLLEKVPLFFLSLGFGCLTLYTQAGAVSTAMTLETRLTTAVHGYGWYLAKTFWPTNLGLPYPHWPLAWASTEVSVSLVVMGVVTSLMLGLGRGRPELIVGWLWFVGMLAPVSGLVQSGEQAMADRFIYVPHLGLLVMIVWGLAEVFVLLHVPRLVQVGLAASVLAVSTWLTWEQAGHWQNTETMMRHSTEVIDKNHLAYEYWGLYLLDQKKPQGALNMARMALSLQQNPRYYLLEALAHDQLGDPFKKLASLRMAVDLLEKHIEHEKFDQQVYFRLGQAMYLLGEIDLALKYLHECLRMNEHHPQAQYSLGLLRLGQGRTEEALQYFDRALLLDPRMHQAWDRKGVALGRREDWPKAADCFRKAKELHLYKYYCANLAFAYWKQSDRVAAANEYREVLKLDADWPKKAAARAQLLFIDEHSGRRDVREAAELIQQACQADGFQDPELLRVQAVVLANKGP